VQVIDPGVSVAEIAALAADLAGAGLRPRCSRTSRSRSWTPSRTTPSGDYRTGLDRLAAVSGVRWIVPGHGHVGDAAEFRRRLDADHHYLDLLAEGQPFEDPRLTVDWQRACHRDQLRVVAGQAGAEPGR
jgi:hypothetical protein